jgi:hypothetical protein
VENACPGVFSHALPSAHSKYHYLSEFCGKIHEYPHRPSLGVLKQIQAIAGVTETITCNCIMFDN